MWKISQIAFLLAVLLQGAIAQRTGGGHFSGSPHFGAGNFSSQRMGAFSRSYPYALPFWTDGLYSDAVYAPAYGVSAPAEPERTLPPSQPLLIELQGDRYVRLSGDENSGGQMVAAQGFDEASAGGKIMAAPQAPEPPSTLLVFRDGHREQISDYTIAGGVLYTASDDYASGTGNKRIDLSLLNLADTVASNRSRGVAFRLPRAANEVIVGP
jgi:hypothetical protein